MLLRRKWGAQWNKQSMNYLLNTGPNYSFESALLNAQSHNCLVLGAGNEVGLINEFCDNIIGLNVSRETLKRIKQFGINLILADAQQLPIKDNCVDLVVCKSSLHHLSDLNGSILGIKRVAVSGSYVFLYEPGLLNIIAFFGRKVFPTDIHEPSEKPFIRTNLRNSLVAEFEVINEADFFLFVHVFPILEKKLNMALPLWLLKGFSTFDAMLCRTFLKNLSWVLTFTLRKKPSFG